MHSKVYQFIGEKVRPIEVATLLKRVLFIRRKVYRINESHFFLDPVSNFGLRLLRDHQYESETTELIRSTLKEGDTFIDLGGNEGYFSVLSSRIVGSKGRVICIEPQQRLWRIILRNVELNHCLNVQLLPYVVSDKTETVELIISPSNNTGSSSVTKSTRSSFWTRQKVQSIVLDELEFEGKIRLLKIDIEGYELSALRGASRILKNRIIENIIVETHPAQLRTLGQSEEEITSFLNGYGYYLRNGLFTLS